jgi:hypothetical protein
MCEGIERQSPVQSGRIVAKLIRSPCVGEFVDRKGDYERDYTGNEGGK